MTEDRKHTLLMVAATLLPIYIKDAANQAFKEGYDMYVRAEPRRAAIQEALALEEELEKQENARIKALS